MSAMRARMRKEIAMLETDPPHGVSAWPKDDSIDRLEAQILGPDGSPYEKGVFRLDIEIPDRYPFEPPKVRFVTPIYHPNIDDAGRICLDTLKMQPKGSWLPSVNISTLLTTVRLLMAEPNADDGLMPEITDMFKHNREHFNRKAIEMTMQHATQSLGVKVAASTPGATAVGSSVSAAPTLAPAASTVPLTSNSSVGVNERALGKQKQHQARERDDDNDDDDSFSDANSQSEAGEDDGLSDFSDDESDGGSSKAAKRRRTN